MNGQTTRRISARAALCAALPVLWMMLTVAGPAAAQTNSPAGNQSTGQAPNQGGVSNNSGSNTGGNTGNNTSAGDGGATGGGSSGAGRQDTGGGGTAGTVIGVVALLVVIGLGATVFFRHRRVMEDVNRGGAAAPGGR